MDRSRRHFLVQAGIVSLGLAATRTVAEEAPAACYDPASLPLSQRSRRRSLAYTDLSSDPRQRCGLCAFFTPGQGNCGSCQMLTGGPVSAAGVCSSFAAKAA